jgi:flagellar hook assembly protein FlgD
LFPANAPQWYLLANFPNPFNPETWIPYAIKDGVDVTIRIHDVSGRLIKTLSLGYQSPGFYTSQDKAAYWDGRNEAGEQVSSGIYFYNIKAGDFTATHKMLMLK